MQLGSSVDAELAAGTTFQKASGQVINQPLGPFFFFFLQKYTKCVESLRFISSWTLGNWLLGRMLFFPRGHVSQGD